MRGSILVPVCHRSLEPIIKAPSYLYSGTQCAAIDATATGSGGLRGLDLMTRAGRGAFAVAQARWPKASSLCVCAGTGNNAGDGYVVAAQAAQAGWSVTVLQIDGRSLADAAGVCQQQALAAGVGVLPILKPADLEDSAVRAALRADLVVDALLGIGLDAEPRPLTSALIERINQDAAAVLALDLPSGLAADRTGAFGAAVQADCTVSFVAPKLVLYSGVGTALAGEVVELDLGLSPRLRAGQRGLPLQLPVAGLWPALATTAYKHARGHVLVIGGDTGMFGAPLLSAEAALRAGAGLVSVITRATAVPGMLARRPELMVRTTDDWQAALALLDSADAVVLGPGLGRGAWGRTLFAAVQDWATERSPTRSPPALVLDADALFLLAEDAAGLGGPLARGCACVLTPHAGEAARLLATTGDAIELDRLASVRALAERYQSVALLKGPGTLIAGPAGTSGVAGDDPARDLAAAVVGTGNPAMATAGMGDVLAGVIGARLALRRRLARPAVADPADRRHAELVAAVAAAATVHGAAADRAVAELGGFGLVAGDVIDRLPAAIGAILGASPGSGRRRR